MTLHHQIATEGIRKGHSYFAVLGLKWFSIAVEVIPGLGGGGGSWAPLDPVYIKVTVTFKDKEWVSIKEKSYLGAVGLALVKATLLSVETVKISISASFKKINNIIDKIKVRAKPK